MAIFRVQIDYHPKSKRFFAKVNGNLLSDTNLNGVIINLRKIYGKQYKLTKKAEQAWRSGN